MSETQIPTSSGAVDRSTTWKVLTGVLAVACAVLVFLLLRPTGEAEATEPEVGGTDVPATSTAESSASLACEVLRAASPVPDDQLDSDQAWVEQNRFGVVASLGLTAAGQDSAFEKFEEAMQGPLRAYSATFSMSGPEFTEALDLAQRTCDNRFPPETD